MISGNACRVVHESADSYLLPRNRLHTIKAIFVGTLLHEANSPDCLFAQQRKEGTKRDLRLH